MATSGRVCVRGGWGGGRFPEPGHVGASRYAGRDVQLAYGVEGGRPDSRRSGGAKFEARFEGQPVQEGRLPNPERAVTPAPCHTWSFRHADRVAADAGPKREAGGEGQARGGAPAEGHFLEGSKAGLPWSTSRIARRGLGERTPKGPDRVGRNGASGFN